MQRALVLSLLSAGLLTVACGAGDPNIVSPSGTSSPTTSAEPGATPVMKFYTVGGVVQSARKPLTAIADASIDVTYNTGFTVRTESSVDGTFSLAVLPGVSTVTVSKKGYEPWSQRVAVWGSQGDLRPLLLPLE